MVTDKTFQKTKEMGEYNQVRIHIIQCPTSEICMYFTNSSSDLSQVFDEPSTAFFDVHCFKEFVDTCQQFLDDLSKPHETTEGNCWSCNESSKVVDGVCNCCGTPINIDKTHINYEYWNTNL